MLITKKRLLRVELVITLRSHSAQKQSNKQTYDKSLTVFNDNTYFGHLIAINP